MKKNILSKIESLPPLPESVIKLEEFRQKSEKEPLELIKIIETDPLIVASLLKVANSAMFGFRHAVETPARAVSLLGINFTISISLGTVMQDMIKSNLNAYNVTTEDFTFVSNLTSAIINNWVTHISFDLKEELLLPGFLQETGKFIISEVICDENKEAQFQEKIANAIDISKVEEEFLGFSCAKITANIFKHWKLSPNLIFSIGFVGDTKNCPDDFKQKSQVLEIVKILCTITHPLSDEAVELALKKAKEYDLNEPMLKKAIENIKSKIESK